AEPDTDEVFAQVTLLPENQDENSMEKEASPPPPIRPHVHSFLPKRPRAAMVPSSPDSSVLTKEGSTKVTTADPPAMNGYSRVLQGQEPSTLKGPICENNECKAVPRAVAWFSSEEEDGKIDMYEESFAKRGDILPKPGAKYGGLCYLLYPISGLSKGMK
ncbi:hypothetical protein IFM89_031238, partial [Coptis chinensis]